MAIEELGLDPASANAVILGGGGRRQSRGGGDGRRARDFCVRHPRQVDVPGKVIAWNDPSVSAVTRSADLLLNATPLGRHEEMPFRPAALPRDGAVIDLVYVTGGTPLVRKARSLGLRAADGWEVLLAQGAISFRDLDRPRGALDAMRDTLQP